MEYNKIIAVTGLPGLYELLNSKTDGAIVRSLDDKSTRFVSSRIHNFSHLESIEVYTVRDNVNLVDILKAMEASNEKLPDDKDGGKLKAYFTKVYPDLDFTRVYSSDLKKMVKWFVVLKENDIEIKLSEPDEEVEESADDTTGQPAQAPKKKKEEAAAKPAPARKAPAEAPAKKATAAPEKSEKSSTHAAKPATAAATAKPAAKKAAAEAPKAEKKAAAAKSAAKAKPAAKKKAAPKAADKPKKSAKKK